MAATKLFVVEQKGSVLVIIPVGNVMSPDEQHLAAELEAIYGQMQQPGVCNLVIDFGQVPYFGSIMLGAILKLAQQLKAGQGKLAMCNLSAISREVLHASRFDTRWPIYASQQEANNSFDEHS